MRRNRRNNAKKERVIMIASSAFVLTALTMTGIYMKSNQEESQNDGYTIDFTQVEDNVQDKLQEIAQNNQTENSLGDNLQDQIGTGQESLPFGMNEMIGLEDDLDYTPMEAGSNQIEIPDPAPELQETPVLDNSDALIQDAPAKATPEPEVEPTPEPEVKQESKQTSGVVTNTLHFDESNGMLRPLNGEVLIPFDMGKTVRFVTLDHYKRNPALMIAAEPGTVVTACTAGKVINIFDDAIIGHAVTMDLGDGYQLTYGQLNGINVTLDSYVSMGDQIATVAEPTKYFCRDGSNLYLKLTKDGQPVNPEPLFH